MGLEKKMTYSESELKARLVTFEDEHRMRSEEFLALWEAGRLPYLDDYFVWAGLCARLGIREREFA